MAFPSDIILGILATSFCGALVLVRCGYRMLSYCRIHTTCHRTWHIDDTVMGLSVIPLAARAACIIVSFNLNPSQTYSLPSAADVAASDLTAEQLENNYVVARKLLIPSRIFYALYLWCLKLCILILYYRCLCASTRSTRAANTLLWSLIITFFAILIPTIGECRPISLFWAPDPRNIHLCHRALGNLVTMAVLNIVTDFALILFPFPTLWKLHLSLTRKIQLGILFSLGILVVLIDLLRLPLIVRDAESQWSRSFWASIEIIGAGIVANAAFYYALLKDLVQGHNDQPSTGSLNHRPQVRCESYELSPTIAAEGEHRKYSHSGSDKLPMIDIDSLDV